MIPWPECNPRPRRASFFKSVLGLLGSALALQVACADSALAANGLTIFRRDLCHSFKLECRKSHPTPQARHTTTRAKPAPEKAAKPAPEAAKPPKPVAAVPTPVAKPPPPADTAVRDVPVPREKPAAVSIRKPAADASVSAHTAAPTPREKPATEAPASVEARPATPVAPIPRERPALLPTLPPVASTVVRAPDTPARAAEPDKKPDTKTASIAPPSETSTGPDTCEQSLRTGKVQFEPVSASFGDASCPVADPVRLHAVETPSGTVTFPEGPVLNCRFARQFAQWVSDTGSAVVLAQTSKRLEKMATGPGYDCRHRNGDSSGKMSEHATGDAVDITSVTVDGGTTIQVADAINPASPSYQVLRALRTTACGYFTTVLGPGANEAHKAHYHFDLGVHGKSANYRICE